MRIRKATLNDLAGIMDVVRNSGYPLQHQYSQDTIKFFIDRHIVFVAEEMNIVGYMVVKENFRDGSELESIEVDNRFHGKGVADQLIERAEQTVKKLKKNKLYIKCWTGNLRASSFYEKKGYKKLELIKAYYSDGKDANLWCKEL